MLDKNDRKVRINFEKLTKFIVVIEIYDDFPVYRKAQAYFGDTLVVDIFETTLY